ncbi:MAG TPA: bifunctional hydroxymethylpyrimidine kinase/phosphomethylpyrimidine kinase [Nitrososphaeraceae archaeon]|nr:bifunctional hydroxymethylpyrimidine kinase/phosphomethylpyrimidine kinase [Nitrososphaeraceae archaeon]
MKNGQFLDLLIIFAKRNMTDEGNIMLNSALTIAGSDSGGGAGIQSDIKTFSALGIYGCSVVTAITSQNTSELSNIFPIPGKTISNQLQTVLSDFSFSAVKIGMVYNAEIMEAVHKEFGNAKIPIVVDPILTTGTGYDLILKNDLEYFKKTIVPLSYLLTPNLPEAEAISGIGIRSANTLIEAANVLLDMGATNVVIKGGHFKTKLGITDFLLTQDRQVIRLKKERIVIESLHGLGCNYSAAVTAELGRKVPLLHACKLADDYVLSSITNTIKVGKGHSVVDPTLFMYSNSDKFLVLEDLFKAVNSIESVEKFGLLIPETSSNLAYAISHPTGLSDVAAVQGRIARVGNRAKAVGAIHFGASKHIGTSVLSYMKTHPQIRSAINLRYNKKILAICKKNFNVAFYDRKLEPQDKKLKEGMSISWGIEKALQKNPYADVIYHLGDIGKEAMILVFDTSPCRLVDKVNKILVEFINESSEPKSVTDC